MAVITNSVENVRRNSATINELLTVPPGLNRALVVVFAMYDSPVAPFVFTPDVSGQAMRFLGEDSRIDPAIRNGGVQLSVYYLLEDQIALLPTSSFVTASASATFTDYDFYAGWFENVLSVGGWFSGLVTVGATGQTSSFITLAPGGMLLYGLHLSTSSITISSTGPNTVVNTDFPFSDINVASVTNNAGFVGGNQANVTLSAAASDGITWQMALFPSDSLQSTKPFVYDHTVNVGDYPHAANIVSAVECDIVSTQRTIPADVEVVGTLADTLDAQFGDVFTRNDSVPTVDRVGIDLTTFEAWEGDIGTLGGVGGLALQSFTLEMRFRFNATPPSSGIFMFLDNTDIVHPFTISHSGLNLLFEHDATNLTATLPPVGDTIHLFLVVDGAGNEWELYLNGSIISGRVLTSRTVVSAWALPSLNEQGADMTLFSARWYDIALPIDRVLANTVEPYAVVGANLGVVIPDPTYVDAVQILNADHYWPLDLDLDDVGQSPAPITLTGSASAAATPLHPDATNSREWTRGSVLLSAGSALDLDGFVKTEYTIAFNIQPNLDTLPFPLVSIGSIGTGIFAWLAPGMVPAFSIVGGGVTATAFATAPLVINRPSHLMFVWNSTFDSLAIYIDGRRSVDASAGGITSIAATAVGATFGGEGATSATVPIPGGTFTTYTFSGFMSDIATWVTALTEDDARFLAETAALQIQATALFTNVPNATEVRAFDIDNGLADVGTGVEFVGPGTQDVALTYDVTYEISTRLALINVEADDPRLAIFYAQTILPREGATFPADLLLNVDRNYIGDYSQIFPPINDSPPVISGTPGVGETFTVTDNGTWGIATSLVFTYQWLRNGSPISGATSSSYVTVVADDGQAISCEVTATNSAGTDSAITNVISLAASGVIGIWRHTTGASPSTAAAVIDYETEVRNDSPTVFQKSGGTWTLPTGRYLVIYRLAWIASGQNGRGQVCIEARKDGVLIPGSRGSGYQRDTANDAAWADNIFIFDADGVTNDLDIRHFRDAGSSVGAYDSDRSTIQIIQLDGNTSYGQYTATGTAALGAQTYAQVSLGTTVAETGSNITRSGSDVTLAANTSYIICGGAWFNTTTARTARFAHLTRDGAHIPGSSGYAYMRDASNEFGGPNCFAVIETGGSPEVITLEARGPGPGGTTVDGGGNLVGGDSGISIIEMRGGAEWFASEDATGSQNIAGTSALPLNFARTTTRSDGGALFTANSNSALNVATDNTLLLAGGYVGRRTSSNGTRLTREADFRLDGAAQLITASGEYNRGDQGSQDTYDSAHQPRGIVDVTSGQVLTMVNSKDGDAGWNDGSTTNTVGTEALGFYALRVDTL